MLPGFSSSASVAPEWRKAAWTVSISPSQFCMKFERIQML
jgi:hypothetical protein